MVGCEDRGRDRPDLAVELGQVLDRLGGAGERRAFEDRCRLGSRNLNGDQLLFEATKVHEGFS